MIRIMIADDQELMRESLQIVLELNEDMHVVAMAQNGEELLELLEKEPVDVILMAMLHFLKLLPPHASTQ